ncbi:MAG: NADH-quinone oxidoreductase subunit NuoH [Dehalococcoidia bacterium]|nr:NADH-quinone oxidoreductase subunit NuoH [Dehalococcoidia bacterium]
MSVVDFLLILLGLLVLFTALSVVVLSLTWMERKFLGRLQRRLGPTRTGPMGLLQPVADALKLVLKEDLIPSWADKAVFWVAPLIVLVPSFMIWVTIPAAENLVMRNLDMGLFYIIAFSVLTILGLVLAGWGSANKYGTLGSLRSVAQLVSYEIPIIMVVIAVAMMAQSLDLRIISISQVPITDVDLPKPNPINIPFVVLQPLGMLIFFIAGLAEVGRTPFDIYFAESEIVGGPFVEYSGAHWSVFFLAEYMNTFVIGALTALLFLGGWYGPYNPDSPSWLAGLMAVIWFLIKTYLVVTVIFWVRGTFPRLRIDQLMAFAWQVVVPLSFLNIVITGIYLFYGWPWWSLTLMSLALTSVIGYLIFKYLSAPAKSVDRVYRLRQMAEARRASEARGG